MRHRRWSLAGVPECFVKTSNWSFCDSPKRHPPSAMHRPHHRAIITLSSRCLFPIHSARNQNPFIHYTMSLGTKRGYRDVNSFSNVSKGGDLPRHVVSFDEHDSKCNNDTNTVQQKIRRRIPLDYSKPCGASLTRRRNDPACMRLSTMTCSIMHVMMMTTSSHYFKTHFVVLPL